ncbi:MAG: DMT family transporter [Candidatus Zixiibacteriota bacterium]
MTILLYIATLILFGSTWVVVKIGLETIPPFTFAVVRFVLAFLLLGIAFRIWRYRLPAIPNIRRKIFVAGFLMYGLNFLFIYIGQQYIQSSLAAVIFATMPFFTGLFAHMLLPNERLTKHVTIGMAVGFIGTFALFSKNLSFDGPVLGMLSLLLSSIFCSWATVLIKRDLNDIPPVQLSILQIPAGLVVLAPPMFFELPFNFEFDAASLGALFYLAILGTGAAFIGWYYLLKRVSAVALSLMTFLEPLVAIALGYVLLSEKLESHYLLGGALILVGVLIATFERKPAAA